jgi:hypothetical protein
MDVWNRAFRGWESGGEGASVDVAMQKRERRSIEIRSHNITLTLGALTCILSLSWKVSIHVMMTCIGLLLLGGRADGSTSTAPRRCRSSVEHSAVGSPSSLVPSFSSASPPPPPPSLQPLSSSPPSSLRRRRPSSIPHPPPIPAPATRPRCFCLSVLLFLRFAVATNAVNAALILVAGSLDRSSSLSLLSSSPTSPSPRRHMTLSPSSSSNVFVKSISSMTISQSSSSSLVS